MDENYAMSSKDDIIEYLKKRFKDLNSRKGHQKTLDDNSLENNQILESAKEILLQLLEEGLPFKFSPFKEDSGTLGLHFFKELDKRNGFDVSKDVLVIKRHINDLSLDQIMDMIYGFAHHQPDEYIINDKEFQGHLSEYHSITEYNLNNNTFLDIDENYYELFLANVYRENAFAFCYEDINIHAKSSIELSWKNRNDEPFRTKIEQLAKELEKNIPRFKLKEKLGYEIAQIWDEVRQLDKTNGSNKLLFQYLNGGWTMSTYKSRNTKQQEELFVQNGLNPYINPLGREYGQFISGLNLYQYKEPSDKALLCVANEMLKGNNPFKNLGALYHILYNEEIRSSPKDYFVLKAFFLQVKFGAGLSNHTAKIFNFLDAVGKENGKLLATSTKLIELLTAYITKGKNHHSNYEIISVVFSIRKHRRETKILRDGQESFKELLPPTQERKKGTPKIRRRSL